MLIPYSSKQFVLLTLFLGDAQALRDPAFVDGLSPRGGQGRLVL